MHTFNADGLMGSEGMIDTSFTWCTEMLESYPTSHIEGMNPVAVCMHCGQ